MEGTGTNKTMSIQQLADKIATHAYGAELLLQHAMRILTAAPTVAASTTTAGIKNDTNKPQMELLDALAIEQLAAVLTFGAAKYAPNNWRKGISSSRLLAAALRHIFAYLKGEKLDPESNLPHLAHAMCCLMFALNLAETRPELTDHVQQVRNPEEKEEGISVLSLHAVLDSND